MNSILITGGTGTFGLAMTQHLLANDLAERVCIYSRNEHAQATMREKFGNDSRLRWFIGDVRDRDRLRRAMTGVDTVMHAAALKRIEVGAYNPEEMVKTNVDGTVNVIEAAQDVGIRKAVLVSSDKAWQPISPYGQTKALAEAIFLAANQPTNPASVQFTVVRYGNVVSSQGSVIPRWRDILKRGESTVPVTDPECTRFFMWPQEAVGLVMKALDESPGVIIPEALPAYRLGDLAEAMGAFIEIKGLPTWEKRHEGLRDGFTSDRARRMDVEELREVLKYV